MRGGSILATVEGMLKPDTDASEGADQEFPVCPSRLPCLNLTELTGITQLPEPDLGKHPGLKRHTGLQPSSMPA